MIVSGQTGSGKTVFIKRLLFNQAEMFEQPLDRIIIAYSVLQPIYFDIKQHVKNVELVEGFPNDLLDDILKTGTTDNVLLVLDDLMIDLENDKRLPVLFTKMRHANISTVFVVQNFYFRSRYMITVTRNAHYLVIFPNPRDMGMIQTLGRQMFPSHPKFLPDAFAQATSEPFGYLLIDCKPTTEQRYRIRDRIFPGEITRVYNPK
jgi:hypothetical protein